MRTVRLAASIIALTASGAGVAQVQPSRPLAYPSPYPTGTSTTVQPVSDADSLAGEIRLLAADPNNVQALVRAGELALKLGDDTAAAAFFTRASRIDPRNARVKAGEGSLLVSAERPGEALRHFAEAESLGGDVRTFAADRALAYDLLGEQERAQRDYRLALRAVENDETRRRYALSLGISGKRELALKEIEPLLRKSDRGAWRSRAFILAMGGDRPGAERIATTMMPAGMAQGLQPFFDLLPTLRPADRAFAVHFGEVRASPTRIADARMAPPMAALGPDTSAPVEVAAMSRPTPAASAVAVPARRDRRSRKERQRDTIVAATTPPVVPLPAPPAYVAQTVMAKAPYQGPRYQGVSRPASSGTRAANLAAANALRTPEATTRFARAVPSPSVPTQPGAASLPSSVALGSSTLVTPYRGAPPATASASLARPPAATVYGALTPTQRANAASATPTPTPTSVQAAPSSGTIPPRAEVPSFPVVSATPPYRPVTVVPVSGAMPAATATVAPPPSSSPPPVSAVAVAPVVGVAAAPAVAAPAPMRSEQSILAAIIADINVPGAELGVAPERMAVTTPPPIQRAIPSRPLGAEPVAVRPHGMSGAVRDRALHQGQTDSAGANTARSDTAMADRRTIARKAIVKPPVEDDQPPETAATSRKGPADKKTLKDRHGKVDSTEETDGSATPGKGTRSDRLDKSGKKAADAKKLADAKKAEEKRRNDPKLLEPQRYWVQVAGGANENDLSKQWTKLKSKNAKALGGRVGYATPQRATNRILTGPFKTEDEAQAFVNSLAKQGMSGFVFASEAGQKVTKLPAK
ncbi:MULTISPECIES: SPOR domain-containing protein [unclassified Sphingomonas]|uniref:SPOR domain-containing protein n=1 Tax=unclassified Sphingomonas TaxID=196159 RepID=UPI001F582755|nr:MULTISPECIES: SPOR domain-containing protein [unclassified Sphingomonas]